jgi:hypothetical protein
MNDYIFIKIVIFAACFGWVYVEKLTANRGLLDFIPQYYPTKLNALMSCSFCVAGWVSMVLVLCFSCLELSKELGFYLFAAPFFAMAAVKMLTGGK